MARDIKLGGGEISFLKAIGTSGAPVHGRMLLDRLGDLPEAELLDTLVGLIESDYIIASKVNVRLMADVERSFFRVNPALAKDLRSAMKPGQRREEQRERRQRRG